MSVFPGEAHPEHGSPYVASLTQTAIAAILIVQTLCSFAVIGYFYGHRPEGRHWFKTLLAPLLGGIGMGTVVVLLFLNDAAAGESADTLLFKLIPWIIVGVFLGRSSHALLASPKSREVPYHRPHHL